MKIKWLGHASFLIISDAGTKIITDPYKAGGDLSYGEIKESADIVTVSHGHGDHNNAAAVRGNPQIVRGAGTVEIKGVKISGVPCYHDDARGGRRGNNTIFCFEVDGMRVCHLGDLGHQLDDKQVADLGKVDILLIPVGGFYTVDAKVATQVCNKLAPRVIVPMHYKNDKCDYPITTVEGFLQGKEGVSRLDVSEVEFKREKLPAAAQIIVLRPAL